MQPDLVGDDQRDLEVLCLIINLYNGSVLQSPTYMTRTGDV